MPRLNPVQNWALAIPHAFRFFNSLIGGRARPDYVDRFVRPKAGDRILDIGCGPGDVLACLPDVTYIGFDTDPRYVEAASERFGQRGKFFCADVTQVAAEATFETGSFDIVMANGVLHHLPDAAARDLLRVAARALKPGGRLVTHDGCYVDGQSRVARYLLSRDRGEHVRKEREYVDLARSAFASVNPTVAHDLLRIPYTILVMECLYAKTVGVGSA